MSDKVKKFDNLEEAALALGLEVTDENKPLLMLMVRGSVGRGPSKSKEMLLGYAKSIGMEVVADDETVELLKIKIAYFLRDSEGEEMEAELAKFLDEHNLVFNDDGDLYTKKAGVKPITERRSGLKPGTVGYATILLLGDEMYKDASIEDCIAALAAGYSGEPVKTTTTSFRWYVTYVQKMLAENPSVITDAFGEDYTFHPRTRKARVQTESGATVNVGRKLTVEDALAKREVRRAAAAAATASKVEASEEEGTEEGYEDEDPS